MILPLFIASSEAARAAASAAAWPPVGSSSSSSESLSLSDAKQAISSSHQSRPFYLYGSGPPRPSCYQGHFLQTRKLSGPACCATRCFLALAGLAGRSPGWARPVERRVLPVVLAGRCLAQVQRQRRDLEAGSRGLASGAARPAMLRALSAAPAAVEVGAPTQQRRPGAPLTASRCPRRWPLCRCRPTQNVVAHQQQRPPAWRTSRLYFST